jgi:hypothetical protein
MARDFRIISIKSEDAHAMTVQQVLDFASAGIKIAISGDDTPEPPVEESIGIDDDGNPIFVPVQ